MSILYSIAVLVVIFAPFSVFAGTYTTSISPSGAQIQNPITATFNIQDFGQKDYPFPASGCVVGFVPGEMVFNYWFDGGTNYNNILPAFVPTGEMISSGIYSATFNLSVGQAVDSIGVEFFQYAGGGGIRCGFYGRQPNGVPVNDWSQPIFTVIEKPAEKVYVSVGRTIQNSSPSVNFIDFLGGTTWSGKKTISYFAVDYDQQPYGLKDFPIHLYLSNDGGAIWKELDKNKPNSGEYILDTNNFPDGINYKLKIIALDNSNKEGEAISSVFSIDNTPPTFEIAIAPKSDTLKEKDKISLQIISSENLIETPSIHITQSGADSQPLVVGGFGKVFSASYTILKGYLGTAIISIKGRDTAGNRGEKITAGETFVVSRFGPSPPVIKNIVDNESFSQLKINIFGSAPGAKEVIFVFNNKDKLNIKPRADGDFSLKEIILSSSDFGRNVLAFSSIDAAGIESDVRKLTVKLNDPPSLSWVNSPSGLISGNIKLEWNARDVNNDAVVYSLLYSVNGGKSWDYFSKGLLENSYDLESGKFFDGDEYVLKVVADDGSAQAEIISEKLVFKNGNSFSILGAPKNYTFDTTKAFFKNNIKISQNKIVSVRYSLEKEEWLKARADDGMFNSVSEGSVLTFPAPFIDGKHTIFIEVEDDAGRVLKTFQHFIIDTLPPVEPRIEFPSTDMVVNSANDGNPALGGIQISVLGKAEAGADLEFTLNNRAYTTIADSRGDFEFKGVTFLSHGVNRYFLSSVDSAGNISKIEGFLVSNNAPVISLLTPQAGGFLSRTVKIKWLASDADDDQLVYQVFYRFKNKNWIVSAQNVITSDFEFDVSKLQEGEYELKIIANDGLSETSAVTKVFVDNTLPTISFDLTGPIVASKIKLLFSGTAVDNLSGIQFIEYSLDGTTWFKALLADGYLEKKAVFVIRHPFELDDGEYNFGVRAIDAAGNISKPRFEKIIVDSAPPRVGSFMLSYGGISLFPDQGVFTIVESAPLHFVVSLEQDAKNASLVLNEEKMELIKNSSTGLWETDFSIYTAGTSTMSIAAEDIVGNKITGKIIGAVSIVYRGETVAGAKITVFTRGADDQSLVLWSAAPYGFTNPIFSDEHGKYVLFLPFGEYQLLVEKSGYQRSRTADFKLTSQRFIHFNFPLKLREGLRGFFENIIELLTINTT